jgi:hypothetical protein
MLNYLSGIAIMTKSENIVTEKRHIISELRDSARDKFFSIYIKGRNYVLAKIMPPIVSYQQKKNGNVFAVNINSQVGFCANLEWCLEIFMHCETYNLTPYIQLTGSNYRGQQMGKDYFAYFFENIKLSEDDKLKIKNKKIRISQISDISQLGLPENYDLKLTIPNAAGLIAKYISIKEDVTDEVNSFCTVYFGNHVLGLHYRGTDKKGEAPRVDWEKVTRNVQYYLKNSSLTDCVFISSDEIDFIHYIEKRLNHEFPRVSVIYRNDRYRSHDGRSLHLRFGGDNYHKGRDALVNCLLLSRCDVLIKTASILSAWSKLFNPELPVIMLNEPKKNFLWFPEREIVKQTLYDTI